MVTGSVPSMVALVFPPVLLLMCVFAVQYIKQTGVKDTLCLSLQSV